MDNAARPAADGAMAQAADVLNRPAWVSRPEYASAQARLAHVDEPLDVRMGPQIALQPSYLSGKDYYPLHERL